MNSLPVLAVLAALAIFSGAIVGAVTIADDKDDPDENVAEGTTPTPEATGTPTATASGTASATPTQIPVATQPSSVAAPEFAGVAEIAAERRRRIQSIVEGYQARDGAQYVFVDAVATRDSRDRLLIAAIGRDVTSTNGAGQRIFYFLGDNYQGTDWVDAVTSIERVTALGEGHVEVVYRVYEGGDPCCPTGTFTWFAYFDDAGPNNPEQPPDGIFYR